MNSQDTFYWTPQPQAEALIQNILSEAAAENEDIQFLSESLLKTASTRLFDWLDFVAIDDSPEMQKNLAEAGFILQGGCLEPIFFHPGAQLPRVVLQPFDDAKKGIGISVDSIADFLMVRGEKKRIEGSIFGNLRRCLFSQKNGSAIWLIEKRGAVSLQPTQEDSEKTQQYLCALEKWMTRPRSSKDEERAIEEALLLAERLVREVGRSRAAWTVLEGERRYWQVRNFAGQLQKGRQDRLGMGWSNHDHHTFRSSRRFFNQLIKLFEILGFSCRERFHAGAEAGWGAQVMENAACRLVLFLDVDLTPEEITQDFEKEPLQDLKQLGTVGLWCALHGESILHAGMHHLEAQFMFEELKEDLAHTGIKMMEPFSNFPYLKQAFTEGEKWPLDPERVLKLQEEGKISPAQAERFLTHGAIGSHLENLQRREGFKGFNQQNVSKIIKKTDPRIF